MQPAQPFTGVQAFYIASKGANKAFAQQFVLDAANSPETMKALFDAEPRPPAMTEVLENELRRAGVPRRHLHVERFAL